jgi:hypothetical protein
MRWSERARERLRPNETVEESIPVGENGVVVTNQRVLAFTPEGDGPNFRAIERPNVEGASLQHSGETGYLEYVGKGALAGVAGIAIGLTVDFGGLFAIESVSSDGAGAVGAGGLTQLLAQINSLLDMADEALLVGGLLALALALGALGMYIESRSYDLVVDVAGEDDLRVRAPSSATDQDRRLMQALESERFGAATEDPVPAEGPGA